MLVFIQHNEETSTFSDYYIEMISHCFSDDLDHRREVNVTTFLLNGMPVVDHECGHHLSLISTITSVALSSYGPIAHLAKPNGLLIHGPGGRRV